MFVVVVVLFLFISFPFSVSITQDPFYDLSLEMPKDQQLKKIGQERGQEALTPQGKVSWFTTFCNYTGITQPQLVCDFAQLKQNM